MSDVDDRFFYSFLVEENYKMISLFDSCYNCKFQILKRGEKSDEVQSFYCSICKKPCYIAFFDVHRSLDESKCVAWKKRTLLQKIKFYLQRKKK